MKRKIMVEIVGVTIIILVGFIQLFAIATWKDKQDLKIKQLEIKTEQLEKSLVSKASKTDTEPIINEINKYSHKVNDMEIRLNGWAGTWEAFFGKYQKHYIKTHPG